MVTFDLIERIHRTLNDTQDKSARAEITRFLKSMYPEAFVENDITNSVRFAYVGDGDIELSYRGKRIGKITIRANQTSDIFAKSHMEPGFFFEFSTYGFKIKMYGSLDIYNLTFDASAKKDRIKEA